MNRRKSLFFLLKDTLEKCGWCFGSAGTNYRHLQSFQLGWMICDGTPKNVCLRIVTKYGLGDFPSLTHTDKHTKGLLHYTHPQTRMMPHTPNLVPSHPLGFRGLGFASDYARIAWPPVDFPCFHVDFTRLKVDLAEAQTQAPH